MWETRHGLVTRESVKLVTQKIIEFSIHLFQMPLSHITPELKQSIVCFFATAKVAKITYQGQIVSDTMSILIVLRAIPPDKRKNSYCLLPFLNSHRLMAPAACKAACDCNAIKKKNNNRNAIDLRKWSRYCGPHLKRIGMPQLLTHLIVQ
jgi:hypothetical protein